MHSISRLAALLVAGALISAPALAEKSKGADQGKVFVTVNGQPISQNLYDTIATEQKAQGAPDSKELRDTIKEQLVRIELLNQEAKKKGLDKKPAIAAQMDLARQSILGRAFLADYVQTHPVSDEQLKKDYAALKAQLGGTEFKSRHVLVESEDEAKAIIAKLDKGEKFDTLAKQSKDPGSKDNGGDLGWAPPGQFVQPFAEALQHLKKGEYTKQPVKTRYGYHVIQLDDTRPLTPPAFEEVKPQLQQRAAQRMVEELINDLRKKAKVE